MQITCQAQQIFRCPPQTVFDLMIDTARFPPTFTGYGIIPKILSITLQSPLAVGAMRQVANADGSVLTEQVTALEAPMRHAYTLSGFSAPFSWLVTKGEADWTVRADAADSDVVWKYTFTLTRAFAYPLAAPLLQFFMARAMQRCLENMAQLLAVPAHD